MTEPTEPAPSGVEGLDGGAFDAVVIGGGILGAATVQALAERGHRCLLIERADFGQGTTSRSTRLIHGGLRYLAMFDFGLVREGLRERAWQLREMPHLVQPLPLLLVHYREPLWRRSRARLGLTLYDVLSPRGSLPRHRHLTAGRVSTLEPNVVQEGLQGADLFWDGQAQLPERLVIEVLRRAGAAGAVIRNYVEPLGLERTDGRVKGISLRDVVSGASASVATSVVVNASGPWADETLERLGVRREPLLRLTQGIHLVYERLAERAICVEHPDDGRLCFAVPWQGRTMVGTTDTDVPGRPEDARIRVDEVEYLQRFVQLVFQRAPAPMWGTVGVRSLARGGGGSGSLPSSVSRRHVVVDHASEEAKGLFTLAGGKLTAWRATGAHVADRVASLLPQPSDNERSTAKPASAPGAAHSYVKPSVDAGPRTMDRPWSLYGPRTSELDRWTAVDAWWREPIVSGENSQRAEVAHAIDQEWARTLADIVLRRLALGFGPDLGAAAAREVATICESRLGWSSERVADELRAFDRQNEERLLPGAPGPAQASGAPIQDTSRDDQLVTSSPRSATPA